MAFTKTTWVNDAEPDITAEQLNRMEQGIFDAHTLSAAAELHASNASTAASASQVLVEAHAASVSNPHGTTSKQVGGRHHINAIKRGAKGDGITDDSTILQALLDELRDAGGGELYLPGDGGKVYRTKCLWVGTGTRVVSDGATMKVTGVGPLRGESPDGDPIQSPACFTIGRQPLVGHDEQPENVLIQGMKITFEAMQFGIITGGKNVRIRDVHITGVGALTAYDGITVDTRNSVPRAENTWIENCIIENAWRNNISLISGSLIWIENCIIRNCQGSETGGDPGCGIEVEPNQPDEPAHDIYIRNNWIGGNAGAGIGLILRSAAGDIPINDADGIVIEGNTITGNGKFYPSRATTRGGVMVATGASHQAVRIVDNSIRNSIAGPAVLFDGYLGQAIVALNDIRGNSGGDISGAPVGSWTAGNIN